MGETVNEIETKDPVKGEEEATVTKTHTSGGSGSIAGGDEIEELADELTDTNTDVQAEEKPHEESAAEVEAKVQSAKAASASGPEDFCGVCVDAFEQAGGCMAWKAHDYDKVRSLIPTGCGACGKEAAKHCGIGGTHNHPEHSTGGTGSTASTGSTGSTGGTGLEGTEIDPSGLDDSILSSSASMSSGATGNEVSS